LVMAWARARPLPRAIPIRLRGAAVLGYVTRVATPAKAGVSLPPSISPILFSVDFRAALNWGFFPIVLTIFIMAFVDTMGTLIGVSARAGFLDENGNLPQIERPMTVDALSVIFAALVGTSTSGAFIESATRVQAGAGGTGWVIAAVFCVLSLSVDVSHNRQASHLYGASWD